MSFMLLALAVLAAWCLLQTVLLVAILRHLGLQMLSESARRQDHGPRIRTRPAPVAMENAMGDTVVVENVVPPIRNVFFLSTTCTICGHLLETLRDMSEVKWRDDSLFVIHGSPVTVKTMASKHGLEPRTVVLDPGGLIFRKWRVVARPFLCGVG